MSSFLSSTSNPITASSVRRNLFSTHLSRRPASGAQPPRLDGQADHHDSQSQRQVQQQQYGSNLPRPRSHQRSLSTPSLSPSPPRLSPFLTIPSNGTNATYIPPPIPQISPPHLAALPDGYDPTISPNRPLTPRSSAALFPNQSIIALNPLTGRPVLPKMPVLPGRLRLTDSDDEMDEEHDGEAADGEDDEEVEVHEAHGGEGVERGFSDNHFQDPAVQAYTTQMGHGHRASHSRNHDPYTHSHDGPPSPIARARADHTQTHAHAAAITAAQAQAEAKALDEADSERRDRERIERLLREMMSRQRARAKGKSTASSSTNTVDDEDEEAQEEKDELMGLILGSLRREIGRAEEEGWMFGEAAGMGAMVGRDEVGVYD